MVPKKGLIATIDSDLAQSYGQLLKLILQINSKPWKELIELFGLEGISKHTGPQLPGNTEPQFPTNFSFALSLI